MFHQSKEEMVLLFSNTLINNYGVIIIALCSIAVSFMVWRGRSRVDTHMNIPGRLGLPFLGETLSFVSASNSTKGIYDFVRVRRLRYGKWFKTRILGSDQVFVPSTEGAKRVLANDLVLFNKEFVKSMQDLVGSHSVFIIPKEGHNKIRRLLSDPLSMRSMSTYVKTFDQLLCEKLRKSEQAGQSFKVLDFIMEMNFDATLRSLMSVTDDYTQRQIKEDITSITKGMMSVPVMIPGTKYYKGMKGRIRLMETFKGIVSKRRSGNERHKDILQSMLDRDSFPDDEKFSDTEILDNLLALIIAGQSTTEAAMMWSVKFLDENQDVQDRLREEQVSLSRSKPDGASLSLEDLNKMPYAFKVVKETLRMSNVVLWFPRAAMIDTKVDGFDIKKGCHVNVDATYIHYDPDLYDDPKRFNPSRFDETQKPYSFIPFGAGPRTCAGINMAKVMMLVFLHRITSGYKWTVDDQDLSMEANSIFPRMKSGCPITLKALEKYGK